jgi:N-acetylglucosamine kinase-like BadF-type ATPase
MNIIIGVEGGGSYTRTAILGLDEMDVIGYAVGGPSNYHNIGLSNTVENIKLTIMKALGQVKNYEIKAISLGLPALNTRFDWDRVSHSLNEIFPNYRIILAHDVHIALYACTLGKPGILVVSGTGSNIYGYKDGEYYYSGDLGWLIGDEGSAFWVGRKLLNLIAKVYDGRWHIPGILKKFLTMMDMNDFEELLDWIYGEKEGYVEKTASIAKIACELADDYPEVLDIIKSGINEIINGIEAVYKRMNIADVDTYYVGGMFNCSIYRNTFKEHLHRRLGIDIKPVNRLPLTGALCMGLDNIGIQIDEKLLDDIDRALERYSSLSGISSST